MFAPKLGAMKANWEGRPPLGAQYKMTNARKGKITSSPMCSGSIEVDKLDCYIRCHDVFQVE